MSYKFVQAFIPLQGSGLTTSWTCEALDAKGDRCNSQGIALWEDEKRKGWALCQKHADECGAVVITGCAYAPTHLPIHGYKYSGGEYVKIPNA